MSIVSSLGMQSSYAMASFGLPVKSIRQIHADEQPFSMPENELRGFGSDSNFRKESTDSTGIVISEETRAFLENKAKEEKSVNTGEELLTPQIPHVEAKNVQASSSKANLDSPTSPVPSVKGAKPLSEEDEDLAYGELTEEEEEIVEELEKRDAEVRAHENAHAAAGAGITGRPSYEYTVGPDGKQYAIGGSVQIETSPVSNDPEATIAKADKIRTAALAADSPSAQDYAVASAASQMKAEAQKNKLEEKVESLTNSEKEEKTNSVAENVDSKTDEALASSSLSALSAVAMYAQYNRPLEQNNAHTTHSSQGQGQGQMPKNSNTFSEVLMPSAISFAQNSTNMNNNAYQEQLKQYANNAYTQVQTRGFARASQY